MKKAPIVLLGALPLASLLAACGSDAQSGDPRVVASFYPYAFVAEQVGGSHVEVDNLTSPGVEPHDVELKPKQVGAVQSADLVIYQRGFQNAVDDAVDQADLPGEDVLDVAKIVHLEESHAEESHEDDGHSDPHTWLDPQTMITVTDAVEKRLSAADPDHASAFAASAQRLERELTQLDSAFSDGLKTCRSRTIVTSHAAFHYLAERYRLTQVPIAGIDPTNEPTPAQLADISSLVKREDITTIFAEELVSPAIAETVARETGATTATLDPIEGLGDNGGDETYLTLMRRNLDAIRTANGCS
ncbi:MAG: metal ABC transporter substrate-binding protein [Aeromicrobium sp.]